MTRLAIVCLGGALGSGARYLFSSVVGRSSGRLPLDTLGVNLIGSFALSFIAVLALEKAALGEDTRLFLATGVLGGFTTYSSFNLETTRLMQSGAPGLAAINVLATLAGCLLAGFLGLSLARALG